MHSLPILTIFSNGMLNPKVLLYNDLRMRGFMVQYHIYW